MIFTFACSFANLDAQRWYDDFQHPINRRYYAGTIVRLTGGTVRYGFEVDDPAPYLEG